MPLQHVGVHMEHGLSGVLAGVEDETELAVGVLLGEVAGGADDLGQQLRVGGRELTDVAVGRLLREHEQVDGGLRRDVADREKPVVLEDDVGRDLARDDALEDGGLGRHASSLRLVVPERPVVTDARLVSLDPVGLEEERLPPVAEVPVQAHAADGEVRPAVGDPEGAEVDVARPAAVVADDRVRCARVTVADDEVVAARRARSTGRLSTGRDSCIARRPSAIARDGCRGLARATGRSRRPIRAAPS